MSEVIKVTVITDIDKVSISITEQPPIRVSLYPVTVAHPSIFDAANQAESSASNAKAYADEAAEAIQVIQQMMDEFVVPIVDSSEGEEVDAAMTVRAAKEYTQEKAIEARQAAEASALSYALIFG